MGLNIALVETHKTDLELANDAELALKLFTKRMIERGKAEGNIVISKLAFSLYENFVNEVFVINKKRGLNNFEKRN